MLKLVKQCAPWLDWKVGGVAVLVVVGLLLCTQLPALGLLAGVMPLLLLVACLVPCLIPLALLRRKASGGANIVSPELRQPQDVDTCDCGGDACSIGDAAHTCHTKFG